VQEASLVESAWEAHRAQPLQVADAVAVNFQLHIKRLAQQSHRRLLARWRVLRARLKALIYQLLKTSPQGIEQRGNGKIETTITNSEPLANGAISANIVARGQ
jgi:hypothetical protein